MTKDAALILVTMNFLVSLPEMHFSRVLLLLATLTAKSSFIDFLRSSKAATQKNTDHEMTQICVYFSNWVNFTSNSAFFSD